MISSEQMLIKYALERDNYYKINKFTSNFEIDNEYKLLMQLIGNYFSKYTDEDTISTDSLIAFFHTVYPKIKDKGVYLEIIDKLKNVDVSNNVLSDVAGNFIEKMYSNKVITKLTPILYDQQYGLLSSVLEDIEEYHSFVGKAIDNVQFVGYELADLLEEENKPGLSWRLDCLNYDLGPIRGEMLGHIFARVDAGKTTFMVSEVAHMLDQLKGDEYILWFHNEESARRVLLRAYCALLHCTKQQVISQADRAKYWYKQRGGDRLRMYEKSIIFVEDMVQVIKQCGPENCKLVVVDIGDKLMFRGAGKVSNSVERLSLLYGKLRQFSKDFLVPVFTTGQAAAEAEGKKFLEQTHMYASKTGKPGELDFALGIGKSMVDHEMYYRYLSVCKNKMHNGEHGKHTVKIDPTKALYLNLKE